MDEDMDEDMDEVENDEKHYWLMNAIRTGDVNRAEDLISLLNAQDRFNTSVHEDCCLLAIEKGCTRILKSLLDINFLKGSDNEIRERSNLDYMSRALDTESVECVDFLLSQGFKLITYSFAWSAFIYCLEHDKRDILKYIVTLPQMNYPNYQLCFAAKTRNLSVLKKALEYPELCSQMDKPFEIDGNDFPPICWCLHVHPISSKTGQELDCVKVLIEAGADIKSCTVLITLAATSEDVETVLYLLDQGVGLDAYNLTESLIILCGMTGVNFNLTLKCVKRLIELGADPREPNEEGETPLSASIRKNKNIFYYILDFNLDKRFLDVQIGPMKIPMLTLIIQSYPSDLTLMEKILKTGCDVNLSDFESNTPLMHASGRLDTNLVKLLLDHGADVNARNNRGKNAGNICLEDDGCSALKIAVLEFLMERGLTLNNEEYSFFLSAFEEFDLQCIKFLLNKDIETDCIGELNQNILHLAADTKLSENIYELLLRKVKDINQKDRLGRTPIHTASIYSNVNLVKLLVFKDCDVNTMDQTGGSALLEVSRRGQVGLTRSLLKSGAKPEKLLKDRLTWLRKDDCMALVLEYGGDVLLNIPDDNGRSIIASALHNCRNEGDEWIINNILTYNPNLGNLHLKNTTPATIFQDEDYFDILDLLYQSGAPKSELTRNSSNDVVELMDNRIGDYSLKSRCRRIIRQKLGLGIKEKVRELLLPESLQEYLLLKDIIHEDYFQLDDI